MRRPRYPGKNPRAFHLKYKELDPAKYPAEVAKTPKELPESDIERLCGEYDTAIGRVRYVKPVIRLSHTPPFLERPSVPMGSDPARWPPRP